MRGGGIAWGDISTYPSPHPAYVRLILFAFICSPSEFHDLLSVLFSEEDYSLKLLCFA